MVWAIVPIYGVTDYHKKLLLVSLVFVSAKEECASPTISMQLKFHWKLRTISKSAMLWKPCKTSPDGGHFIRGPFLFTANWNSGGCLLPLMASLWIGFYFDGNRNQRTFRGVPKSGTDWSWWSMSIDYTMRIYYEDIYRKLVLWYIPRASFHIISRMIVRLPQGCNNLSASYRIISWIEPNIKFFHIPQFRKNFRTFFF